jgi:hypothetical protein
LPHTLGQQIDQVACKDRQLLKPASTMRQANSKLLTRMRTFSGMLGFFSGSLGQL